MNRLGRLAQRKSLRRYSLQKLPKRRNMDSQVGDKGLKIAPSQASFDLVTLPNSTLRKGCSCILRIHGRFLQNAESFSSRIRGGYMGGAIRISEITREWRHPRPDFEEEHISNLVSP
jgi:hypothetical protein